METKILVTGAPGNVGTYVVEGLRAAGVAFRVAAWDVDLAKKVLGDDLDIVHFDFLDETTYGAAFDGIERMFLVRPPQLANVQEQIAPAIYAAVEAGVKHVVFLSLQGVENNRVTPHFKIEQLLNDLDVSTTYLRASFFMQNLTTTHRSEIRDEDVIAVPVGRARTSFIDARDIAAVAVCALTEDGHQGKAYTLTGKEALDYYTVAETLSDVLHRPIRYTHPSVIGFVRRHVARGTRLGYVLVMAALYTITRFGNASEVTPDVERLLHREPISFRRFAEENAEVWMRQPAG